MSKESYIRGFCKVAEDAGVSPRELAKFAQSVWAGGSNSVGSDSLALSKALKGKPKAAPAPGAIRSSWGEVDDLPFYKRWPTKALAGFFGALGLVPGSTLRDEGLKDKGWKEQDGWMIPPAKGNEKSDATRTAIAKAVKDRMAPAPRTIGHSWEE